MITPYSPSYFCEKRFPEALDDIDNDTELKNEESCGYFESCSSLTENISSDINSRGPIIIPTSQNTSIPSLPLEPITAPIPHQQPHEPHLNTTSHHHSTIGAWSRAAAINIKQKRLHTSLGIPFSTPLILLEFLVRIHLEQFPKRYAPSLNDVDELISHMILLFQAETHEDYRVSVRTLPIDSTLLCSPRLHCMEITICCIDKPKVATLLTRVLDGTCRDVLDANIMTSKRNMVLDRFIVEAYPHYTPELLATTISSSLNPSATPQILREVGRSQTCITYEALAANSSHIIMKRPLQPSVEDVASFTREAQLMQSLPPHPNICGFVAANLQVDNLYICYEYMAGGSLADRIRGSELSIEEITRLLLQIATGMMFLHSHGVLHRDLKSTNVMLDDNGVAKICDFGISRREAADMTAETGTYRWMAPEVIRHEKYSSAADVYSFGILAWELLARDLPYAHMTPVQAAFAVVKEGLRPPIPSRTPTMLASLMKACWDASPRYRPNFELIVNVLSRKLV